MYAYAKVIIERPGVRALPLDALDYSGDQTFCWIYENGKAVRTEIETGVSDGEWIEVTNRRPPVAPEAPSDAIPWTPIDGTEQVILGDLSVLADGAPVEVAPATAGTKHASEHRPSHRRIAGDPSRMRPQRRCRDARPVRIRSSAIAAGRCSGSCSVSWPPWRRRGATTRRRTTIRASASLRPCG